MGTPIFLLEHEPGCTPPKPCAACEAVDFLRNRLTKEDLSTFFDKVRRIKPAGKEEGGQTELLTRSIDTLELTVRAENGLKTENIETIGELVKKKERELLRIPFFGKRSVFIVKEALMLHGLKLAG